MRSIRFCRLKMKKLIFHCWNPNINSKYTQPFLTFLFSKNWKKITNVSEITLKDQKVRGVVIADKTGDIFFLNEKNMERLAKDPETVPSMNAEGADKYDYVVKLLYGHQQTCIAMT